MTELKEYDVPLPSGSVGGTMRVQLSDAEAKRLGLLKEPKAKKAPAPKNKAVKATANKKS